MFCVEQINKDSLNNQMIDYYITSEINNFVIDFLEAVLLAEQEEYTSRKKYEHIGPEGMFTVYRNGYRYRHYITRFTGLIKLKVPRCRGGQFSPVLFRKGVLTDEKLEDMLIQLWTDGNSYRDLREYVSRIYGARIGLSLLNRIVNSVEKYVQEYHGKEINHEYDVIFLDGLHITVKEYPKRSNDEEETKKHKNGVILAVLGQRREGNKIIKEILDYRICQSENKEEYEKLLRSLKKRGLSSDKIKLAVHDGDDSIVSALDSVYGEKKIKEQDCLIHKQRNIVKSTINKQNKKEIKDDVWKVYSSKTKEEFLYRHEEVLKKWQIKEPEAMKIFALKDNQLTKYDFEYSIHKEIHSNNPIERTFREIRRRTKAIGIFETVRSADKLIFLIVENINQRRGCKPTNGDLKFTH